MKCRLTDLRNKEVVNILDGMRLGYVCDVLLNTINGQVVALVVPGPFHFLSFFFKKDDRIIPWECIKRIGDDIILVESQDSLREKRGK